MFWVVANGLCGHKWAVGRGVAQSILGWQRTHTHRLTRTQPGAVMHAQGYVRWRPRFLRITLPCNYLGIMRESRQRCHSIITALRLGRHLSSSLLVVLTSPRSVCCPAIFSPLSLARCVYLSDSLFSTPSSGKTLEVFRLFSTVEEEKPGRRSSALSLLLSRLVSPNYQSLRTVLFTPLE